MTRLTKIAGTLSPEVAAQLDGLVGDGATTKYHNQRVTVDGETFDSRREADRWCELLDLQRSGAISGLRRQVRFDIDVQGTYVCRYIADFVWHDNRTHKQVVSDAKGFRTPVYRLKKKLLKAALGIDILET